jgi:hypothetical protein
MLAHVPAFQARAATVARSRRGREQRCNNDRMTVHRRIMHDRTRDAQ